MVHGRNPNGKQSIKKPLSDQERERRSKKSDFKKRRKREYAEMAQEGNGREYLDEDQPDGADTSHPVDQSALAEIVDLEDGWLSLYGIQYMAAEGRDDGNGFTRKQIARIYDLMFGPVSMVDSLDDLQYALVPYREGNAYVRVNRDGGVQFPVVTGETIITDNIDELPDGRRFLYED